ncbi:isochorismate synthase [Aquimarina sp. 2201CG5-10]|uniref:isochorismate synthase n=1 Tax=Aquimarina callyspongiae TaxID=3098150 RepID=UPI002AB45345|nr:isochorismate synthase [Aquimarina sp. 2201CG5-10]MDY8135668.1 isochorismate synthase [Aquimarina sp. 2201CG5-10]
MGAKDLYVKIQQQLDDELPLVIYRKSRGESLNAFLQKNNTLYNVDDYSTSGFVFAPFDISQKAVLIPESESEYIAELITDDQPELRLENRKSLVDKIDNSIARQSHIELVEHSVNRIRSGDMKKVVVSRKEEISLPISDDVLLTFKRLLNNYSNAFVYLWYHPKVGTWLGATPETLLQIKNQEIFTMALAGTQIFEEGIDVVWKEKEKEEQRLVTEFIVKELTAISDNITTSETYTHRAGTLLHLRTDIKATINLENSKIEEVIKTLHPTPAVCGLPKSEAKTFILNQEGYDRKFYTGFLGELNLKRDKKLISNLFVNLRCMELEANKANLYIGGGITKDSIPEKEWEETVKKTETIKRVL